MGFCGISWIPKEFHSLSTNREERSGLPRNAMEYLAIAPNEPISSMGLMAIKPIEPKYQGNTTFCLCSAVAPVGVARRCCGDPWCAASPASLALSAAFCSRGGPSGGCAMGLRVIRHISGILSDFHEGQSDFPKSEEIHGFQRLPLESVEFTSFPVWAHEICKIPMDSTLCEEFYRIPPDLLRNVPFREFLWDSVGFPGSRRNSTRFHKIVRNAMVSHRMP